MWLVVNTTLRPLYPRERPGIHLRGGWVGNCVSDTWIIQTVLRIYKLCRLCGTNGGGARSNAVGTTLQAGRSRTRFPMCPLRIFIDLFFRPHYGRGVKLYSNWTEYQEYLLGGKGGRWLWLTTLPPPCADCPENLRASTCWSPQGLPRLLMA